MISVKDQMGRNIVLNAIPQRVVSLVPSQTELLVDLGLENNLVGVTKFCVHPSYLRNEKIVVGGTKQVNYNKIKSLQPDLIICNKEENTKEMVKVLEQFAPVWVSDIVSIEDNNDMILRLGSIFNVSAISEKLVSSIKNERIEFSRSIQSRTTRSVIYLIWKKPYMAAGKNTFIDTLLAVNNFKNVVTESRYPGITESKLQDADVVLLSSEPYPFKEADVLKLKNTLKREVRLVDGEYFSWYGSRLLKAFKYFKSL